MKRRTLLTTLPCAAGWWLGAAVAQQKVSTAKPEDKFAAANEYVKKLLLLMDADKNGKISRQEWMSFMEAEFNRLDKEGKGEIDSETLFESKLTAMHVRSQDPGR